MSRTRILITEVVITKAGQRKNFQIKMPKNAITVIGVANDLRMNVNPVNVASAAAVYPSANAISIASNAALIKTPPLTAINNLSSVAQLNKAQSWLVGKLLLQSLEKANIFYADQIWVVPFDDGIGNITDDPFAWDAFELPQKAAYKTVSVPAGTTIINGMFRDLIGASVKRDIAYIVKVLLWIETNENETIKSK
jgi:hypothetical protein